jgi:hypothetical protein
MRRRKLLVLIGGPRGIMSSAPAVADSSGPQLASYYERHMALLDGRGLPVHMRAGITQVGVSQSACFALQNDGRLISWGEAPETAGLLMPEVGAFASGQSGWFAIDHAQFLWHGGGKLPAPRRIAEDVVDACIGDSADYYIRRDGTLWVKGLAHRGQYGDGRLTATADFVNTAGDAVAVKPHTGHALYLSQGGVVALAATVLGRWARMAWATRPIAGVGCSTVRAPSPPARVARWPSAPTAPCGPGEKVSAWNRAGCSRGSWRWPRATRRRLRCAQTAASCNGPVAPGRAVYVCCEGPALQQLWVRMQSRRQCSR